ncbi:Cytochrome b561 domain-containing protein [Drosera capensis]
MLSRAMNDEVILHGVILWASTGVFMPVGILVIRLSSTRTRKNCGTRVKVLFYLHIISQILSVLLSTAAAVLSIKNFGNSFSNIHQKVGLSLYLAIWIQTLVGFSKPQRGTRTRCRWYITHWMLGTTIAIVGIINIYTGLQAYEKKTSTEVKLWKILFTVQIAFMVFLYLFQEKFDYLQQQAKIASEEDDERMRSSDQHTTQTLNVEELRPQPCPKVNALQSDQDLDPKHLSTYLSK